MTPAIAAILTNREAIAIDQDPAGHQGHRASQNGEQEIWIRPLADGSTAVALFNRAAAEAKIAVKWADLGLSAQPHVRDLWLHRDVAAGAEYSASVPAHGVVLLRVGK